MGDPRSPRETLRDRLRVDAIGGERVVWVSACPNGTWPRVVKPRAFTPDAARELASRARGADWPPALVTLRLTRAEADALADELDGAIAEACRDLAAERRDLSERNRRAGGGS